MQVVDGIPPNFESIVKVFPGANKKGIVFTYGDKIYAPGYTKIPYPMQEHEQVHSKRQGLTEESINQWWDKYLSDLKFRFDEELMAHKREYICYAGYSRDQRRAGLSHISKKLASPLYGSVINNKQARRAITGKSYITKIRAN